MPKPPLFFLWFWYWVYWRVHNRPPMMNYCMPLLSSCSAILMHGRLRLRINFILFINFILWRWGSSLSVNTFVSFITIILIFCLDVLVHIVQLLERDLFQKWT